MLIFYHSPWTRSTGVRILLEELAAPHEMRVLNRKAGENRAPEFLAINPLGKVPTVVHDGALITEQGAIYTYLADLFPDAGLAPPIGDKLRGPYLRWLAFYGSSFEPALIDRYRQTDPGPAAMSPYGSYDAVIDLLQSQLATGPYLFGDRFSAADLLWGTAFSWTIQFKLVPDRPVFTEYAARIAARPIVKRVNEAEAALAATQHPQT